MFGGHSTGQLALGNQLAGVATNRDIPNMLGAPDVNGFAGGRDESAINGTQMIGGDERSYGVFFFQIDAHQRCKTPRRFRQNAGGSAVQNSVNLMRAPINRKPRFQKIGTNFQEFQPQVIEDIIRSNQIFNLSNAVIFEPDHKTYCTAFKG